MLNFHNQSFMKKVDTKCSIFILYSTSLYPNKSNNLMALFFISPHLSATCVLQASPPYDKNKVSFSSFS